MWLHKNITLPITVCVETLTVCVETIAMCVERIKVCVQIVQCVYTQLKC